MTGNIVKINEKNGKSADDSASTIYEFLGIRYGVPPVGDLRFSPSSIYTYPSPNSAKYDATKYGDACYQQNALSTGIWPWKMSEDCLFLNIWTPCNIGPPNNNTLQLLPVMVFIHGGGFISGAGSLSAFDSTNIVTYGGKNVVVITINYRLGALGFFASEELYNENMKNYNISSYGGLNGIYDQIIAIKWIKKYISSFGGNPNDITIFGESAGGLSTCMLFLSPLLRDNMINKVIIESGACNGPWGIATLEYGLNFSDNACINANVPNNLTYLRELEPLDLLQKLETSYGFWVESVDNFVLTQQPRDILLNLENSNMLNTDKVIIGFNSLDGTVARSS